MLTAKHWGGGANCMCRIYSEVENVHYTTSCADFTINIKTYFFKLPITLDSVLHTARWGSRKVHFGWLFQYEVSSVSAYYPNGESTTQRSQDFHSARELKRLITRFLKLKLPRVKNLYPVKGQNHKLPYS